jgi:predicted amidohydrolase
VRVALLELPARWNAADAAFADVERLLDAAPCDLALLPEAALTGYVSPRGDFDLRPFAEPLDGPTAARLAEIAARRRVHLVGPLIERANGAFYNSVVGFAPNGERFLHYRKRHPWIPETWATPGDLPYPLVEIDGLRVTLAICYDIHFFAAEGPVSEAELLLFPSAWVEEDGDSRPGLFWELDERFDIAVANANWGFGVPSLPGQGDSGFGPGVSAKSWPCAGRVDALIT